MQSDEAKHYMQAFTPCAQLGNWFGIGDHLSCLGTEGTTCRHAAIRLIVSAREKKKSIAPGR